MSDLVRVTEGVWAVEKPVRMPGGMRMSTRMTVLAVGDGKLVLHSPVELDAELALRIESLGRPAWIVAPNKMHHLFAGPCAERFPEARVLAAPGLREKIPSLRVDGVLGEEDPFGADVAQALVRGAPDMNEIVFFHRPSRTLVVSDLLFNIKRPDGFMAFVVTSLMGTRGKFAKSRLWRSFTRDRADFDASVKDALAWDFDRVIMAHGDVVDERAKERALAALGV